MSASMPEKHLNGMATKSMFRQDTLIDVLTSMASVVEGLVVSGD